VVAAEAAEQDLIDAIAGKGGIINPADKAELDALKAAVDTAKGTAQGLVDALPASEAEQTKMLQDRLDALTTTVPAVNDTDSDGTIDSTALQQRQRQWLRLKQQSKILSMRLQAKAASSILLTKQNWMHLKQPLIQRKAQLKV
jgi:hypothetical protein